MTTTPHPKARRGGRTWSRWTVVGSFQFFMTRHEAYSSDAYWCSPDSDVIKVRIVELRRGKGGGKA